MTRTEKAGWIVLGGVLVAAVLAFFAFLYLGPGETHREIKRLGSTPVYEAAWMPIIQIFESIPEEASLSPTDSRATTLRSIIHPATYSYISKSGPDMSIECGGGFLHYGYKLSQEGGGYLLILEVEEKDDIILKRSLTKH